MARETRHIDISDMTQVPAWRQLVDEVHTTQQPTVIRADGEDVAVIVPAKGKGTATRGRKAKAIFSHQDSLWQIVGLIEDDGATDVSSNKHRYLAEAYMPKPR